MGEAVMVQKADLVRRWFEKAGQAQGPLLPDGWFGDRPRDNIYFLEGVEWQDDALTICLTDETVLRFDGETDVYVDESDLVFSHFRRATLRWREYGGGESAPFHELIYTDGQIRLAAPIGKKVEP